MNERIKELAEQAGVDGNRGLHELEKFIDLERFADLVRQDEREQWTPVEIGVDVTLEGAHVVGMYVLMPEAVRHVFYSQFHPAPKREWVGLTEEERDKIIIGRQQRWEIAHMIEAALRSKNNG